MHHGRDIWVTILMMIRPLLGDALPSDPSGSLLREASIAGTRLSGIASEL